MLDTVKEISDTLSLSFVSMEDGDARGVNVFNEEDAGRGELESRVVVWVLGDKAKYSLALTWRAGERVSEIDLSRIACTSLCKAGGMVGFCGAVINFLGAGVTVYSVAVDLVIFNGDTLGDELTLVFIFK